MIPSKTGIFVITIFLLSSLYLGLSGLCKLYVEEEVEKLDTQKEKLQKQKIKIQEDDLPEFTNKYDYSYFMTIHIYEKVFPLITNMPSFLGLVLTSMCFGMIGSIVNILKRIVNNQYINQEDIKYFSEPILGLFTGLCVLGISYVLPTILVSKSDTIRPITLMFFALFFGIYSKKFFDKLDNLFPKFFKNDDI